MRESLTILAILLIIVLTAALVGPYFVDWSAQRHIVEAKLSEALGTPVRIGGGIDLKLLPTPKLMLSDVAAGGSSKDDAVFSAAHVHVELAIADLLRGDFNFTQARFDGLRLKLAMTPGGLTLPARAILGSHKAQFEKIIVRHGTLIVDDGGQGGGLTLSDVDVDAEASSLNGPFRGSGSLQLLGRPIAFRFSTGNLEPEQMRLKLIVDETAGMPRTELDGALVFATQPGAGGAVSYRGTALFSGSIPPPIGSPLPTFPWRISGSVTASLQKAVFDSLALHAGDEDRPIVASGSGEVDFGDAAHAQLTLVAKQIDLDHMLAVSSDTTVRPLDGAALVRAALVRRGIAPLPLGVDLTIGLVTIGGDAITDLDCKLAVAADQSIAGHIEANGPGRSRLSADGTLEAGAAAGFKGHVDFAAREAQRFAAWAAQGDADLGAALATYAPFKTVSVAGDVELSGVGFAGRALTVALDRSSLAGTLVFTRAVDPDRARLFADLTSDSLDVDSLPDIGVASAAIGTNIDLGIHVLARSVTIARLGDAPLTAGRIEAELTKTGGDTTLDHLTIADLGGAAVSASGALNAEGGHLKAQLDAANLTDLADLARRLLRGRATQAIAARAAALSPAKLSLAVETRPDGSVNSLTLNGTTGTTQVSGSMMPGADDPGSVDASLTFDSSDATQLLRQMGLDAPPLPDLGDNSIAVNAHGRIGAELEASVDAHLVGADLSWSGHVAPDGPSLAGVATLNGTNAAPLLQALGLAQPGASVAAPANLAGDLSYQPDRLALQRINGSFGAARVNGDLALAAPADTVPGTDPATTASGRYHLSGTLAIDRLPGAVLAGLALGTPQPAGTASSPWSEDKLGAGLVVPFDADVTLRLGTLDFGGAVAARDVAVDVGLRANTLSFANGSAGLDGGRVKGNLTVRRNAALAALSGHVDAEAIPLQTAFASGTLSAAVDFAGTGTSAQTLVGGLAGQGALTLLDAHLPGLDADALSRVIAASDAEKLPLDADAVARALAAESDRGARDAAKLDIPAALAGGVLRLGPVSLGDAQAAVTTTAAIDLRASTLDMETELRLAVAPKDWTGTPPQMTVSFKGPLSAPAREVETASFFNGLSARALAINLERLEALDADIRERAFFNRRLKAIQADEERERQRALDEQEAARRRSDEERRKAQARAAEAARAAQQPPAPAAEDPTPAAGMPLSLLPPATPAPAPQ